MDITNKWLDYLQNERGLSLRTIQYARLAPTADGWLSIPVENIYGEHLFNKYRRAPWMDDTLPKYKYEKGSTVSLYNIHALVMSEHLKTFICEGELEALTMHQLGYPAVSSTGGVGTFKEEFLYYMQNPPRDLYLWFDNDDAGITGAVKAAFKIKKFTYVWTPPAFGKDINDLYAKYGTALVERSIESGIPVNIPPLDTATQIRAYRYDLNKEIRRMSSGSVGTQFLRALTVQLSVLLQDKTKKKKKQSPSVDGDAIARAKEYPIENILEIRNGFARYCPFHNPGKRVEHSPSFKVYTNNTAYCFGGCGGKPYDSIDIFMQVNGIPNTKEGFKEALTRMNG